MPRPFLCLLLGLFALHGAPRPVSAAEDPKLQERIEKLILQLGAGTFRAREAATRELLAIGAPARAALERAAEKHPELEGRRRAGMLLATLRERSSSDNLEKLLAPLRVPIASPPWDPRRVGHLVEQKGTIQGQETWKANQTWHVTGTLTIAAGTTLTLEAGTMVLLDRGVNIVVEKGGTLIALSEQADKPIVFSAIEEHQKKAGHWGNLLVEGSVRLQHVEIRRSAGVKVIKEGAVQFEEVGIYHTAGDGLAFQGSRGCVRGLTIREATRTGLLCNKGFPILTRVRVSDCHIGIQLAQESSPGLSDVTITHLRKYGMVITQKSSPSLDGVVVVGAGTGVLIDVGSDPHVAKLTVADCRGDGVVVDGTSTPTLKEVILHNLHETGLVVLGQSVVRVGPLRASQCKKGETHLEVGSRIAPLTDPEKH